MSAKKDRRGFHVIHLKKNTEGTSNEISFDVLEARKEKAEGKKSSAPARPGGIKVFTLPHFSRRKVNSTPTREDPIILSGDAGDAPHASGKTAEPVETVFTESVGTVPVKVRGFGIPRRGKERDAAERGRRAEREECKEKARAPRTDDEEIAYRKHRRRTRRRISMLALVPVVILLVLGVSNLVNVHQRDEEYKTTLHDAIEMLAATDDTVIAIDDAVYTSVDAQNQQTVSALVDSIPTTTNKLDQAQNKVQQALSGLSNASGIEAANQTTASIKARKSMILAAKDLIAQDLKAKKACDNVQAAWDKILTADLSAREAVQLVERGGDDNVVQSEGKSQEAIDGFQAALELLGTAQTEYPSASLSLFTSYVNKRIEEQGYALASDAAIVLQDRATAESNNSSYNAAAAEAAAIARRLPEKPMQPILDAYTNNTSQLRDTYRDARMQAAASDAFIRDYLGR